MCAHILNSVYEETLRAWCPEFWLTSLILKRIPLVILWHIYLSAVTSQFLFVDPFTWPFFWNEKVKMLLTLSVPLSFCYCGRGILKVCLIWGSGRHPPSQRRPSLCCAYCVRSWSSTSSEKGIMHHVLLDMPIKGLFFSKEELLLDHMSLWEI